MPNASKYEPVHTMSDTLKSTWHEKSELQKANSIANHLKLKKLEAAEIHGIGSEKHLAAHAAHSEALKNAKHEQAFVKGAVESSKQAEQIGKQAEQIGKQKTESKLLAKKAEQTSEHAAHSAEHASNKTLQEKYHAERAFSGKPTQEEKAAYQNLHIEHKKAAIKEQLEHGDKARKLWAQTEKDKIEHHEKAGTFNHLQEKQITHAQAEKMFDRFKLEDKSWSAMKSYTGKKSKYWNETIAASGGKKLTTAQKALNDKALSPIKSDYPVTVYHGMKPSEYATKFVAKSEEALKTGKPVVSDSFLSASVTPSFSHKWASADKGQTNHNPLLVIHNVKTGAYAGNESATPGENELIKGVGVKYKVLKIERPEYQKSTWGDTGVSHVIHLEEI
jgi:hypothetical protein